MKCFMTNQDCIFEREIQDAKSKIPGRQSRRRLNIFLVSPFGYPYDEMFTRIIEPRAKITDLKVKRADRSFQLGFVMCQRICKQIQEAEYVMADITEPNPNVYYELGLAWGFGKKVLLIRDTDHSDQHFDSVWKHYGDKIISYKDDLLHPQKCSDDTDSIDLAEILTKYIDLDKSYQIFEYRKPTAYISSKQVCICHRPDISDNKFYDSEISIVAKSFKIPWKVVSSPISTEILTSGLPLNLASSKIWIVDVTHYSSQIDPMMYFALGLAHSLGRETIPITNKARCGDVSPFDVRGLWQIYFERLDTLQNEFKSILGVIDETYNREMREYPLRFVWDHILEPHGRLKVFTCARGATGSGSRVGGRTNVDKWDYISVAELSFFLAQKYKQAEIHIRPPEEKRPIDIAVKKQRSDLKNEIEDVLSKTSDSVIIIGSPDVSDYAEVVLAKAYGVEPYEIADCKVQEECRQRNCWDCDETSENNGKSCIGKCGYMFYKNKSTHDVQEKDHSIFFRVPPPETNECVVWYGKQFECNHTKKGDKAEGKTYGVLTILKDGDHLFGQDRWLILLSGYTGIGTYGLAKILTQGEEMKKKLEESKIEIETQGVQFLVSIDYDSENKDDPMKDTRRPKEGIQSFYNILEAEPVFKR